MYETHTRSVPCRNHCHRLLRLLPSRSLKRSGAPAMQKGISVQLAVTSNAVPMPDADQPDALIVTVTADGSVYLGIDPVSPAALAEKVKANLNTRSENTIYIKADARTPFANVVTVLDALLTAGVKVPNLLTSQGNLPRTGTLVPPTGLPLQFAPHGRVPGRRTRSGLERGFSIPADPNLSLSGLRVIWPVHNFCLFLLAIFYR